MSGTRRLAAIVAADVAGFSRLMEADEEGTLTRLKAALGETIAPAITAHRGRIFKTTGDGWLAEFASVVDAMRCAVALQAALIERAAADDQAKRLDWRMGLNVGDVIVEDGDVHGDGVNVAARLEALAEPGTVCISGEAHGQLRGKSELGFDDLGEHALKNIERPVRVYRVGAKLAPTAPIAARPALPLPDKPSLVVLPFQNMSGDPEQEYFADGMTEEITTALGRIRQFVVIARNTAFTYKGNSLNLKQVGRELGVRYLLEGSVRKAGGRMRITGQLIEAETGAHLWADKFDGALDDVFDLQDRVATSIVGALEPSLQAAEIGRARSKRPEDLGAYDYLLQALPHVWSLSAKSNVEALRLLDQVLRREPTYALAHALSSWCLAQRCTYFWSDDPERDRATGLGLARRSVELDSDDPMVLVAAGTAETLLEPSRDLARARLLLDKAVLLDPNNALAWNRNGWACSYDSEADLAIAHFERALRLSPFDPMTFNVHLGMGGAHFVAERYHDSVACIRKSIAARPDLPWHRTYVAACVFAGDMEAAREALGRLVAAYPDITVQKCVAAVPFRPPVRARLAEGLRRAGMPE